MSVQMLRSRRVVTPQGERPATVIVREGRISSVEAYEDHPEAEDFGEGVLLPGLVDTHVHINEPGNTEWEGFASATQAAAAGGVTTLVDMPLNSLPVTTTVEALEQKRAAAAGQCRVDVGFHAGLVPGNAKQIEPLLDAGCLAVKAFLCHSGLDAFPNATRSDLEQAMPLLAERGATLMAHAELVHDAPLIRDPSAYADYLASRPRRFEAEAITMMIELCEQTGCRSHVVHLSDADSLAALERARATLPLTVETCQHYLTFAAEDVPDGAVEFKCAPPIRERENRERLWTALRERVIDLVVSDHSPCPPAMKAGGFDSAWGGIASLQLGLPAVWTGASARGFELADVARWMAQAPAQLVGLAHKGRIEPGADADLVVFDPDARSRVEPSTLFHRHTVTPYAGMELRGRVQKTYLGGALIFENGRHVGDPSGRLLSRGS